MYSYLFDMNSMQIVPYLVTQTIIYGMVIMPFVVIIFFIKG
jgi:hypothetical protein